jgi:uncharacterized protein (DUF1697 family)
VATQIVLLRGINVGSANRIAMPVLRDALTAQGFGNVRTYLQSGNVLADSDGGSEALITSIREVIDVPCVVRQAEQLDAAIAANPFPDQAAENPKLLQVTFRTEPAGPDVLAGLAQRATDAERVAVNDCEIYSWHPDGIARSKLALAVAPARQAATARNWNTVLKLAELAHA